MFLLFVVSRRRLATGYAANVRINRASQKRNAINFTLGSTVLMLNVDRGFKLRACFNKIVKVDVLAAYTLCQSLSNFVAHAQAVLRLLSGGVFMYLEFCDTCENVQ